MINIKTSRSRLRRKLTIKHAFRGYNFYIMLLQSVDFSKKTLERISHCHLDFAHWLLLCHQ